jgi:hypothetical protein
MTDDSKYFDEMKPGEHIDYHEKPCTCTSAQHNHGVPCPRLATEDDGLCEGCHKLAAEELIDATKDASQRQIDNQQNSFRR